MKLKGRGEGRSHHSSVNQEATNKPILENIPESSLIVGDRKEAHTKHSKEV